MIGRRRDEGRAVRRFVRNGRVAGIARLWDRGDGTAGRWAGVVEAWPVD